MSTHLGILILKIISYIHIKAHQIVRTQNKKKVNNIKSTLFKPEIAEQGEQWNPLDVDDVSCLAAGQCLSNYLWLCGYSGSRFGVLGFLAMGLFCHF